MYTLPVLLVFRACFLSLPSFFTLSATSVFQPGAIVVGAAEARAVLRQETNPASYENDRNTLRARGEKKKNTNRQDERGNRGYFKPRSWNHRRDPGLPPNFMGGRPVSFSLCVRAYV